ncbi:hypothetical protein FHS19_003756 [Paenibacillus rhizosphaerae]|uniref:Uncharacterized protein n=1 Tax=Paenibacillus rhizosphaerae TaxID=297318 RepID=A0A839TRA6_9BACL|nr:hypothetical protein [Paenibacillus rhizosphaerae]
MYAQPDSFRYADKYLVTRRTQYLKKAGLLPHAALEETRLNDVGYRDLNRLCFWNPAYSSPEPLTWL